MVFFRTKYFRDFAFIHINKTGGSSIEKALGLPLIHKTAREYRDDIGAERWRLRFSFAIVRNPWDRAVSQFHYRKSIDKTNLESASVEFPEWVRSVFSERSSPYLDEAEMFLTQADWVCDESGIIIVDYVGKFERLQDEWEEICRRLNRPHSVLPHVKRSPRVDYRDYYDSTSKRIISEFFARDIELFGYRF